MSVLQHTGNERDPCLRQDRPDRFYRDTLLSLVLVPVNMDNVHWGLMVLDVKNKEAYFDDDLGYSFSKLLMSFLS